MLVPGRNPVIEALRAPQHAIKEIFLQTEINLDPKIAEILDLAKAGNTRITYVSRAQLEKICNGDVHQGVVAKVELIAQKLEEKTILTNMGMYVYIREAQYEHNIGAIIRTGEAAGIAGIIIAPKQDLTGTIARISMGAIFHLPVYSASLFPTIKLFKDAGQIVSALEINGEVSLFSADMKSPGLLIVGGEDKSVSSQILNQCDQHILIPQFGKVNSLNMSVAAAVAIYEHVRQRQL